MGIEQITAASASQARRLGGKSAGLGRLLQAGATVPEAWVIPAAVSLDPDAREAVLAELGEWIKAGRKAFPGAAWAVRSSAVAEDLEGASFAGVYETVLGVSTLPKLRSAVKRCWAAHDSARAGAYREAQGLDGAGGIALVLQRLVRPRVSGVMLTTNPRRAFADEIAIDAAYGLGEAIVSGQVDPDHIVLTRSTGEVRSEHIGTKAVELVHEDGVTERAVDEERASVRCLGDADLAALHALAQTLGPGRDVEWAIEGETLYALQDRPITNLPPGDPGNVWTRRMGDEYLSEYSMPLPQDLMAPWMGTAMFIEMTVLQGRLDLVGLQPMKNHNGYSYMNGEYIAAASRAFPRSMRGAMFGEWFTPLWQDRIDAEDWDPKRLLGMMVAPWKDKGRGTINANLAALEQHCDAIDRSVVPKLSQDYGALSLREWRAQMDEVEDFGLDHFRVIRWGMGQWNTILHRTLSDLLRDNAGDEAPELYHAIISGIPGTRTAALNREVWDLGVAARCDTELLQALRSDRHYADVRAAHPDAPFWREFDVFLARHGHRSASRDIAKPRWHEQPEVVLGLIRAQLHSEEPPESPRETEARAEARREAAEQRARELLGRGPLGIVRTRLLAWVCRYTQAYTAYRENQRYHLDYLLSHLRALVLEMGRRLVAQGKLAELEDVFFLSGPEFWDLIADRLDRADEAVLAERREHFLRYRNQLPASFLFDDVETEGELAEGEPDGSAVSGDGLSGLGASRGVARGRARVIPDLAHLAEVEPGEILVANNIDPGWTAVFPLLAGLITETGGILSHGAILAREYGIPTVTGVAKATELIQTGESIEVDGNSGTISQIEVDAGVPAAH